MDLLHHRSRGVLAMALLACFASAASAKEQDPASLWADFNHYVRIARPDLAEAAGTALMDSVKPQELLDTVEAGEYQDYELTLDRAVKVGTLRDTAQQLAETIQSARIERSREPQRIQADIRKLAQGKRANLNATQRLKAAGQFAAPYLVATLLDEDKQKLHSLVLSAMIAIGRPMVYPLSAALLHLEPVPLGQVSQVLAEIGYPEAMPYLKHVLETSRANPITLSIVQIAHNRLAKGSPQAAFVSASQLYLELAWRQYNAVTNNFPLPGFDEATGIGLVWEFDREAGLVSIPVPGEIYGDVLAMRSCQEALRLDTEMDSALSLWLTANLRRENRLPQGERDRSYPASMHAPSFYIEMAGPLRQHDVLDQALNDGDTDLALDAIAALGATAGTNALINREGTIQPLLRALAYPDRRVRFNAAFAMTNARPKFTFPGSDLVVPVLAEAVRQTTSRHAITIADEPQTLNDLSATVKEVGYQPIGGLTLQDVISQVNTRPSVDLIVAKQSANRVELLYRQTAVDYRLAAVPIIAIVSPLDRNELRGRFPDTKRLFFADVSDDLGRLRKAFEQAAKANHGVAISATDSTRYASSSLNLLREIAVNDDNVFNVSDAQSTLTQALDDSRQAIVAQAAGVLSLIDTPGAQVAIAGAAFDIARPMSLRVALLESLSESARLHGNYLSEVELNKLLELIKTGRGELVNAAAQAHGALTLPTSNLVPLIIR